MDRRDYKEQKRKEKREFNRQYVYNFKLNKQCSCCGNHYPPEVLDFHHKDPDEKENTVAVGSNRCWSTSKLQEEMDKCVLLCANCHRLVHAGLLSTLGV